MNNLEYYISQVPKVSGIFIGGCLSSSDIWKAVDGETYGLAPGPAVHVYIGVLKNQVFIR